MKSQWLCVVCVCSAMFNSCAAAKVTVDEGAADANGEIRSVTLYRDRALVMREIKVPQGEPLRSIEVDNLPELVMPESVYAEGDAETTVRAVRISTRPIAESQRAEVRELDNQIERVSQLRADLQLQLEVLTKNLELLGQMIDFSANVGKVDLNRGVLDATSLTELTDYSMNRRSELAAEKHQFEKQIAAHDKELGLAREKRARATSSQQAIHYQARIFVRTADGKPGVVRLNYMVGGCGWSPQYSVRGRIDEKKISLQYSALVSQMSGEDWSEVRLVLSTASPSVSSSRPKITPLRISSKNRSTSTSSKRTSSQGGDPFAHTYQNARHVAEYGAMITDLRAQQRAAESSIGGGGHRGMTPMQRDLMLNSLAGKMQQIELQADAKSWSTMAPDVQDDLASQVYTLSTPASIDTRREQQLVQILETELDSEMYHVATPLLSTFAFREVQVTNTEPLGLLAGPATVFLDDRFVGRTQIPSTASGQRLTVGFGADQQVRTRRELVDKDDSLQGGNRRLTFKYKLVLSNFKDQPVTLRLFDRMPVTRETQQLKVELTPSQIPLSDDGLYKRVMFPAGVLRWDVTVPAGRHGSKAYDVHYGYLLEFDRNQLPTTEHMLADMRSDYRDLMLPSGMGGMGGMGGGGQ